MGRLSGVLTGGYQQPTGGGRLSGVVTGEAGRKAKSDYYVQVEKQARYQKAVEEAQKAAEKAQKAQQNLQFWEGIAGAPKAIYQAAKETGAAVLDVGTRLSPLEGIRNVASGVSEVVKRPQGVPATTAFEKGVTESKGRQTAFEKVSGKQLTNPDGSINWDAGRQFIGRAAEAPTYLYAGAVKGAELAGKGLLSRILTRSAKALPEAGVNTAIQTLEEGNLKNAPRNFLANALLMSGISNVGGEINLAKIGNTAKQTIDTLEKEVGPVSLTEKADVMEALQQGVKPSEIIENARKIKNNEFTPDEIATKINEMAGEAPKTPQVAKETVGEAVEQVPTKTPVEAKIEAPVKKTESPIAKKVNTMLDEASKIDENLPTTSFRKQFSKAEERINKDAKTAYNDAIYGKEDDVTKSALQLTFLENAKNKGDDKAIGEIGTAMARHGRKSGQEVSMFRSLYEQDPMNKLLVDTARTKLSNVEAKFPKILRKTIKGEEGDIITASRKEIEKRAKLPIMEAQSIIDGFICK